MKDKTICHSRIVGYVPPLYHRFVISYAKYTGQSQSEVVVDCIKKTFDSISFQEKEKIFKESENKS
jgi:hypothetical protein